MIRAFFIWLLLSAPLFAAPLSRADLSDLIIAPYALGEQINDKGVWGLLNSGGGEAGFVFETGALAPLPGFSGQPINILVVLDLEGRFIDTRLISQREPIFVSGLGEAPLRDFLGQYQGRSINEPMVVGTPYGDGHGASDLVYLDGVTKATASVRIAHETILAAALAVAREKMQGVQAGPPPRPDLDHDEALDWESALDQGLVRHLRVSNGALDAAFAGTKWASDDPLAQAAPDDAYIDLYAIDIGPPAIARAVLASGTLVEVAAVRARAPDDELILLIEAGRHGLVSDDFVRNTAPDRIAATQDALPLALRDADILPELHADLPDHLQDATLMVLRLDRRLGFDPAREWELSLQALRLHGMFQPEARSAHFKLTMGLPERFFLRPDLPAPRPPWLDALIARKRDIAVLGVGIVVLFGVLWQQDWLVRRAVFTPIRLGFLAAMTAFVGFWGQGQLSIVTPLAVLRGITQGGGLEVLLYDPFSLMIWGAALIGFVLWGRGLFCGWLCPFGALQEFAHHLGRWLGLPEWEPPKTYAKALAASGPLALAGVLTVAVIAPDQAEAVAEIEPFKTAITMQFARPLPYVLWAGGWLVLAMVWFKGFCRTICPLGALMRIGGYLRLRNWIARREDCGRPCQLCRVKCRYGAISREGAIDYPLCFQCLDCVVIHDDPRQCVPLVLAAKRERNPK